MSITTTIHEGDDAGIAEVVVDAPPVNALTVQGWYDLASEISSAGANPAVNVVVLRAEGKGFNAGVDIKEMQRTEGFDALVGANRGCYTAFRAVYECEVPVVAAVASGAASAWSGMPTSSWPDATFGLPEVDRGALGAATHLARLVPQHRMRAMVYTAEPATAQELHHYGSVYEVVPPERLRDAVLAVARKIADKSGVVIRAAKESLNGIDPVDVNRSYRYEQGFTFELNLRGEGDRARDEFVGRPESDD